MSAIPSTTTANAPSTTNAFQELASEDFVRIMFTELTNQDPLAPNDSQALLEQISSIRAIESDIELGDRLRDIALQNEIASSGSLLGSFVRGLNDSGARVLGFVDSVSITREGTVLNLSTGQRVALDRIEEVFDPALVEAAANDDEPDSEPDNTSSDPPPIP